MTVEGVGRLHRKHGIVLAPEATEALPQRALNSGRSAVTVPKDRHVRHLDLERPPR